MVRRRRDRSNGSIARRTAPAARKPEGPGRFGKKSVGLRLVRAQSTAFAEVLDLATKPAPAEWLYLVENCSSRLLKK
jgi:hypothetical protein